jgi:hypothetical protein
VVVGIVWYEPYSQSNRLRRRALREPDKTLDDLLTMGRALEMADAQSLTMERDSVNKVHLHV